MEEVLMTPDYLSENGLWHMNDEELDAWIKKTNNRIRRDKEIVKERLWQDLNNVKQLSLWK